MPNPENIQPYSDLAHKAAVAGGPEKFLDEYGESKREIGWEEGFEEGERKGIEEGVLTSLGVTVVTLITTKLIIPVAKRGYNRLKEFHQSKKNKRKKKIEELQRAADEARASYLTEYQTNDGPESEEETIEPESTND